MLRGCRLAVRSTRRRLARLAEIGITGEVTVLSLSMDVQTWDIAQIRVNTRLRRRLGDLSSLKESMRDRGLINPVTVTADGELIAGERRLRSAEQLGWAKVDVRIWRPTEGLELLDVEAEENLCRLELTPGEAELYWQRRKELIAPTQPKNQWDSAGPNLGQANPHDRKTGRSAAKGTGYSEETLKKVEEVRKAAEDLAEDEEVREEAKQQYENLMTEPKAKAEPAVRKVRQKRQARQKQVRLGPGQRLRQPDPVQPDQTLTQRMIKSIGTVRGLDKIAAEIQEVGVLDLDKQTIAVLRKSLREQNKENTALYNALGSVSPQRRIAE
jgi:ParB family transcriptional regulator, chromosome partitioning protein